MAKYFFVYILQNAIAPTKHNENSLAPSGREFSLVNPKISPHSKKK